MLLAALLAIGRSFAVEEANGARDGLRLSGLDGGAIFVGKAAAIAVELFLLEVVLGVAVVALYGVHACSGALVLVCAAVAATIGLAATGTVYGVLATGLRARDTLVPLLVLPAVTPGDARRVAGVRGRARRHELRRVAVGAAARRVLGAGGRRRAPWPSVRCWRSRDVSSGKRLVRRDVSSSRSRSRRCSRCVVSPPDAEQGDVVRLLYLHVPTIWIAYLAFFVTARRVGPVARPAHPPHRVGPARGRVGRGRRRVHRAHARRRLDLGPPDVGHVLGVGRAAHHAPRSSSSCTSATSRCGAPARPPTSGASGARSRR